MMYKNNQRCSIESHKPDKNHPIAYTDKEYKDYSLVLIYTLLQTKWQTEVKMVKRNGHLLWRAYRKLTKEDCGAS